MKSSSANHTCFHIINRLWRRKHVIFIAIILISLVITITYTGSNISSSLFSNNVHESNTYSLKNKQSKADMLDKQNSKGDPIVLNYLPLHVQNIDSLSYKFKNVAPNKGYETKKNGNYVPNHRLVHLDLKGGPPKLSYFRQLFPLLKVAGATGILIEFEDMFPFEGDLKFAAAGNAYSKQDVKEINQLAQSNDLQVIPLIQAFGHLEYFLKLEQYRHLREVDEFPQAICPSKNESFVFITKIIDQVMALYPNSKWLHIGCDEVFHIGICDICSSKFHEDLFLSHVQKVGKYIKDKYNVKPIIWDDMLRQFSNEFVKKYELDKIGIEIMIWTYIDDIYRFIPYSQWVSYSKIFTNLWGASAFKGAFGETLTVPNIKMHLDNNIAWLKALEEQSVNFKNIQGLVLTGWQRYDHLGTLCELLPSGLPSLIISLLTIKNGKYESSLLDKFDELMKCKKDSYYESDQIFREDPNFFSKSNCDFPGSSVFRVMERFDFVNKKVDDYLYDVTIHKAWLTDYNFRHNISSPFRINEGLQEYYNVLYSVKALLKMAISALSEVYDDYTVYEWIEQKIYPQWIRLEKFYNNTIQIQKNKVWPKRPIKPLEDLKRIIDSENGN